MTTTQSDELKASESGSEPAELKPTPADEWPTNDPQIVTLPSGAVARLRRPQWYTLYRTEMPAGVKRLIDRRRDKDPLSDDESMKVLNYAVCAAMVDPPGSLTRRKGYVYVSAMDEADRAAILRFGGTP